jgi:hypothetical protein
MGIDFRQKTSKIVQGIEKAGNYFSWFETPSPPEGMKSANWVKQFSSKQAL